MNLGAPGVRLFMGTLVEQPPGRPTAEKPALWGLSLRQDQTGGGDSAKQQAPSTQVIAWGPQVGVQAPHRPTSNPTRGS